MDHQSVLSGKLIFLFLLDCGFEQILPENKNILDLMNRAKCPETKAEYDHRQNQMKRVLDPETGRIR